MILFLAFWAAHKSGTLVSSRECEIAFSALSEVKKMFQLQADMPGATTNGRFVTPPRDIGRASYMHDRLQGSPSLPEGLLSDAVGDPDVFKRLSRHAHQVQLPAWSCICCRLQWPCISARNDLLMDLGWVKVAVYCAVLMGHAARDLKSVTPMELWQRFLEWTEPPESTRNIFCEGFG